jgi:hypothetical protein
LKVTLVSAAGPGTTFFTWYGSTGVHDSNSAVSGDEQVARTVPPADENVRVAGAADVGVGPGVAVVAGAAGVVVAPVGPAGRI